MQNTKELLAFGPFLLDVSVPELKRENSRIELEPKALAVLSVLVREAPHTVGKELLFREVWGGTTVEDQNLTVQISNIRAALGDSRARPLYIVTVPRIGYRFVAPVTRIDTASSEPGLDVKYDGLPRSNPRLVAFAAVLLLATLLVTRSRPQWVEQPVIVDFPLASMPSISRDGRRLLFVVPNGSGGDDCLNTPCRIYWMQDSGRSVPLSKTEGVFGSPKWAPDSQQILFVRRGNQRIELVTIQVNQPDSPIVLHSMAANSKDLLNELWFDWSATRNRICFPDESTQSHAVGIFEIDPTGKAAPRELTHTANLSGVPFDTQCSYSADGRRIAFVRRTTRNNADLAVLNLRDESVHAVANNVGRVEGLVWESEDKLLVSASFGCRNRLWRLSAAGGGSPEPVKHTPGAGVGYPSYYRAGPRAAIVFAVSRLNTEIRRYNLHAGTDETFVGNAEPGQDPVVESPAVSASGSLLAFTSRRTEQGCPEIFLRRINESGNDVQLTSDWKSYKDSLRFAADGQQLLFSSEDSHQGIEGRHIYILNPRSPGAVRRLELAYPSRTTGHVIEEGRGAFVTDQIFFRSNYAGTPQIWSVAAKGGVPRQRSPLGYEGFASDDGWFYYVVTSGDPSPLRRFHLSDKSDQEIPGVRVTAGRWALTREHLFFLHEDKLLRMDLTTQQLAGEPIHLTPPIRDGVSADAAGTSFYFTRQVSRATNIMKLILQ